MKEIGAYEAKTHLPNILESVSGGESFLITRRGKPVAMLVPIEHDQLNAEEAAEQIRELRKGVTWGEKGSTKDAIKKGRR